MYQFKRTIALALAAVSSIGLLAFSSCSDGTSQEESNGLVAYYAFEEGRGSETVESVSGKSLTIQNVYSQANQANLMKPASDPLWRTGVKGNCLYMDGVSNYIEDAEFKNISTDAITVSAWVAPRVFENNFNPEGMTCIVGKGDVGLQEGWLLGYGYLGTWGLKVALEDPETGDYFTAAFYDPVNYLPLYEWSHVAASYDAASGHVCLYLNGKLVYEQVYNEYAGCEIIASSDPLRVGKYIDPATVYGIDCNLVAGLLDEVRVYDKQLSHSEVQTLYADKDASGHPVCEYSDVMLDSSVYEGDRYRPQYHAIPPGMWMNEPHAAFYYNGYYHLFYQSNPNGPYWAQIRWSHWVSTDMVHWEYVKEAVVPTRGICPDGVWTGGAVIGPDGTPWLVITAGTTTTSHSGQNIAFAHCVDPTDPYLTEWVVEDTVAIMQEPGMGEQNQFRDPFIWKDDGVYYMMIGSGYDGTSGGALMYTSEDMRDWEYHGYVFQSTAGEAGIHWECIQLLPISTRDGSMQKYVFFLTPQYADDSRTVECYYWIGTFDKASKRFVPDAGYEAPRLLDYGYGIFTGQTGFSYLTEEDATAGKTYEQGRTILFAIAQGKEPGTTHNYYSGWAHNASLPMELYLSDDGTSIAMEPIEELHTLRTQTVYASETAMTAEEANAAIGQLRGDSFEIRMKLSLSETAETYSAGLYVRFNPYTNSLNQTERTGVVFGSNGVYIDRSQTSLYVMGLGNSHVWDNTAGEFDVVVYMDRSMLEVYVNGTVSFTSRMYPKYEDSDYLRFFAEGCTLTVSDLTIYTLGSAYSDTVTPAYYGNTGSIQNA